MVNIIINDKSEKDNSELMEIIQSLMEKNNYLEEVILSLEKTLKNDYSEVNKKLDNLSLNVRSMDKDMNNRVDVLNEGLISVGEGIIKLNKKVDSLPEDNIKANKQIIIDALKNNNMVSAKNPSKNEEGKLSKNMVSEIRKKSRLLKDTDVFIPNNALCADWNNLSLRKDGKLINKGRRKFVLPIDLNDLFYIIEMDNPYMTRGKSKELQSLFNVNVSTWGKLIHNIRVNNFEHIIQDYNNRIKKVIFGVDDMGNILIDKSKTNIPKKMVYDWIQLILNSNHKEETILKIQKENKKFNKYDIRIICDSYNNNVLLNIIDKPKPKTFIENNPSKRRNMISNGGLL